MWGRLHNDERGQAIMLAIMVTIVGGLIAVAVVTSSLASSKDAQDRKQRAASLPHVDTAVHMYQLALNAGVRAGATPSEWPTESNDYILGANAIAQLTAGSTVYSTGSGGPYGTFYRSPISGKTPPVLTMREKLTSAAGDQRYGYFQIVRVDPPTWGPAPLWGLVGGATGVGAYTNLRIWIRAWEQDGNGFTKARLVTAEFRPGYFSDYQMLSDTAIRLAPGARINGHIHSNGFLDGELDPPSGDTAAKVWLTDPSGTVTCTGAAMITTGRGTIHSAIPAACNKEPMTNRFINITRTDRTFETLQNLCGQRGVRCL
jgi:hypothetical protein